MQVQDVLVLPLLRLLASGIGFMLVTNCLALLFRAAVIGQSGERAVPQALVRLRLPALHDVVLADTFGHTQVDHLVRTAQGIVVIETKTFADWISGTLYGAQWTQHLAGGRVRHRFQSPVRQNHRHCKAVEAAVSGLAVPVAALSRFMDGTLWVASVAFGELAVVWARLGWRSLPAGRPGCARCIVPRCARVARRSRR